MKNLKIPNSEISSESFNNYLDNLSKREKKLSERNRLLDSCILEKNREIDRLKNHIRDFEKSVEVKRKGIEQLEITIKKIQDSTAADILGLQGIISEKDNEINDLKLRIYTRDTEINNLKILASYTTPDGRFKDNGYGTVTDNKTGLMWKKYPERNKGSNSDSGSFEKFTWDNARQRAEDINRGAGFAGYNDWRLPNIDELKSILDQNIFPDTHAVAFWSSSVVANYNSFAWIVNFSNGNDSWYNKDYSCYIRLVRK